MKPEHKLSFRQESREEQQEQVVEAAQTTQQMREFASAEDLLRYDASKTTVPPEIGQRLEASTRAEGVAPKSASGGGVSWWKRLLG